ncbi:hypothetical protein FA13DRAFT_773081 [Coprinellus micaceus]|uniref:Uncharacterized protein n=1 Tax=Coprinellus micaceus TaxID=71717 RepID=A0A4Y7T3I5_COPMI|nr:hypothetical protein FA13DRAFT_138413 [Coprinellus micaceus]TEB28581.1 hypothetical protein FA13DRAFT_773081 [Coprinellus micaceus]
MLLPNPDHSQVRCEQAPLTAQDLYLNQEIATIHHTERRRTYVNLLGATEALSRRQSPLRRGPYFEWRWSCTELGASCPYG